MISKHYKSPSKTDFVFVLLSQSYVMPDTKRDIQFHT